MLGAFSKNYLPKELLPLVDTREIEIEKDSFISQELQKYYSDLLYKVKILGQVGYVYILFEHKSLYE